MTHEDARRTIHDVALLIAFAEREAGTRADGTRASRRSQAPGRRGDPAVTPAPRRTSATRGARHVA
jgi:hypothetical protein